MNLPDERDLLRAEAGDLIPGQENVIYLLVSTPDGKPAQATVSVVSAQWEGDQKVEVVESVARTDAVGCAAVRLRVPKEQSEARPRRGFMWQDDDTLRHCNSKCERLPPAATNWSAN